MAKPECRYCGTRVEYFGDVCASCDDSASDDFMVVTARQDAYAMQQRMADGDY